MWQPIATIDNLKTRAQLLAKIRNFFADRDVLEVETPVLSHSTIPDPNIHSFSTKYYLPGKTTPDILYLQTSPEFSMKRLLAANNISMYQICKAFRNEEYGRQHNPEFTMLEWYRVGFNHHNLMEEMDELLQCILNAKPAEKISYAEAFEKHLNINPHSSSIDELQDCALKNGLNKIDNLDKDDWLNLLITHFIERYLGINNCPTFIYDYPATQAALAKINPEKNIAERFEVYINGVELANGFHELADSREQRARFIHNLEQRKQFNLPLMPLDENFLAALNNGLPNCAGVALGLDRILMLLINTRNIADTLSFTVANA